jgi:hypothetical protein
MTPGDIRDIRGPIAIPYWWVPYAIAAAVIAALAVALLIYRLVRRRLREHAKTAAEIAIERIERARAGRTTQSSSEFSTEVSGAIRAYVEAQFAVRATHRTTEEFLHDLLGAEASPIAEHRDTLEDFLCWCDLAKFARLALAEEHAIAMVDAARRFVEATATPTETKKPRPAPVVREERHAATSEVGT